MTALRLADIAELVSGTLIGDPDVTVSTVAGLADATECAISFLANPTYLPLLRTTQAGAVLVSREVSGAPGNLIQVDNPDLAFDVVVRLLLPAAPAPPVGVHPSATVSATATVAADASIGAGAVIGKRVSLGAGVVIHPNVTIGAGCQLGAECQLYPGVVLYHDVSLGARVILHANAVIGSDGFGYAWDGKGHQKSPQVGRVVLGDDVEIGAGTTVDRARFGVTEIGSGTKLDNLIQIGHNVKIGTHCAIAALAGISGSTTIGNGVLVGGQVGIAGHVTIGDGVRIAAGSGVSKDIPPGETWMGYPAQPLRQMQDEWRHGKALPRLRKTVRDLATQIKELQDEIESLKTNT